jgi:hypothetical protein
MVGENHAPAGTCDQYSRVLIEMIGDLLVTQPPGRWMPEGHSLATPGTPLHIVGMSDGIGWAELLDGASRMRNEYTPITMTG